MHPFADDVQSVKLFASKLGIGLHDPNGVKVSQSVVLHFFVDSVYLHDLFDKQVAESPEALAHDVNA